MSAEESPTVATLAYSLSEPMQNAITYGKPLNDGTIAVNIYSGNSTVKALKKRGLCDGFRLTVLGQEVRNLLLAQPLARPSVPGL